MKALDIIKYDIRSMSAQLKFMFAVPIFITIFCIWAGFCAQIVAPRFFGHPERGIPIYLLMIFSPYIFILISYYLYTVYKRSR